MTAIQIQRLTKDFGSFRAVDDVSFDVPAGATTGFIGANGAGKTTTMRMALGLITPTSGTALFDGQHYEQLSDPRRHVGAVVDRIGAHPGHTARQHLTMIAKAAQLPMTRVDECLDEVGLLDAADRKIGRFSTGMTQRCALAAAILGDPQTLILDEPASGLDPGGIRWLRKTITNWANEGRAILVSTHQLAELSMVVDNVVVLHEGAIAYQGPAAELLSSGQSLEDSVFNLIALSHDREPGVPA
ncbi:MAG: ABC transporter ATP-binding protein [Acidimicrobiales bacterium]